MGNTPSKVSPGRTSHKLSKPRITSSSTARAPTSTARSTQQAGTAPDQAPALISIPYSATSTPSPVDEDHDEVAKEPSDRPFLVSPKVQRRLSLFRSKSSQDTSERRKSRRNTIIGSSTPTSEAGGVSRAQSLSTHNCVREAQNVGPSSEDWPSGGNRASWAYDMSSYEVQRILNLVKDHHPSLPRSQTSTSLCESIPAEMQPPIGRQTPSAGQVESAMMSRSNSEISLHPPMRRRSIIQTPGVATRTRPSPNITRSRRSSLRHSHPPTPSMSRQPSFETSDSRFLSLPPLPVPIRVSEDAPRVLTPKDTDYSTTGAFKFGSLRITNGSPVSTPSMATIRSGAAEISRPSAIGGVDYFASASTGGADMPSAGVEGSVRSSTVPDETLVSRTGSVVRGAVAQAQPPLLSITTAHGVNPSGMLSPESQTSPVEIHQKLPATPLLKTQSKQAAVDDDLFEDDDQLEMSGAEVLDIRIDPNAKSLPPQRVDWSQQDSQGITRSDSGFESNAKSESSQSCNSLTKADSGYSSNMSLRSLRNETIQSALGREAERSSTESERDSSSVLGRGSRGSLEKQVARATVALEVSPVDTAHSDRAPTPPPKDAVHSKPESRPSKQTAARGVTPRKVVRSAPAAIDTNKGKDKRGLRSPGSAPPTPASVRSEESTSSLSIGNSVQKPGRLQRFLSLNHSARQPLTVHETHTVDNEVPSIPKEVEDKLREHTGLFPTTARRLALKSQMSKETLKTILSVGSLEVSKDNELPVTPTTSNGDDGKTTRNLNDSLQSPLKQTFSSMQTNFKSVTAAMVQSRREIVRKPVPTPRPPQKQDTQQALRDDSMLAAEAELISYTSVTSSLGSNAYDVAAKAMRPAGPPSRSQSMTSGREHVLQLRTYSLSTAPSSALVNGPHRPATYPQSGSLRDKRKTSPPISMAPRNSFRSPPPRSPLSPQGPAVLRSTSHHGVTSSMRSLSPQGPMRSQSSRRGQMVSVIHPPSTTVSDTLTPSRNSQDSPRSTPVHNRHGSMSPVRREFMRDSQDSHPYYQGADGPFLKHRSNSLDGFGRSQLQGAYTSPPAHRGPTPGSVLPSYHGNPQSRSRLDRGRPQSEQPEWAPPYVPRGPHRRNLSAGSRPYYHQLGGHHAPYRILHSYNSPAYRNAPIWG